MKSLERFWIAVDRTPGLSGVPAYWKTQLQGDLSLARRFLRPRGRAVSYPRLDGQPFGPTLDIVTHDDDSHVAICRESGERIELTTDEITLQQVDRPYLVRCLVDAFRLEPCPDASGSQLTRQIGWWQIRTGRRLPVFLALEQEALMLQSALHGLAASSPCLVFVATRSRLSSRLEEFVHSFGSSIVVLSEALTVDEQLDFQVTEPGLRALEEARVRSDQSRRDKPRDEFRLLGEMWVLSFAGKTVYMRDSPGLRLIARLLVQPDTPVHVAQLMSFDKPLGSSGERLDEEALNDYRNRLSELQSEIDEAKQFGDGVRHEKLCEQREAIVRELAAATGLGGRRRKNRDAERLRRTAQMSIRRAVGDLEAVHPELARFLVQSISTGMSIIYRSSTAVSWSL